MRVFQLMCGTARLSVSVLVHLDFPATSGPQAFVAMRAPVLFLPFLPIASHPVYVRVRMFGCTITFASATAAPSCPPYL